MSTFQPVRSDIDSATVLAEFVENLEYETIPESVLAALRLNLADTLGVIVGARGMPHADKVIAAIRGAGTGGPASVFGYGFTTSVAEAALANGFLGHAYDFDDASKFVHCGCVIVPALAALSDARPVTARDFMTALVAGYETAVRVGWAAGPRHRKRGFHPTGTCGIFGATAGAARLGGLTTAEISSALGFAGSMASGITRYRMDGSANKHLHAGLGARNAVTAAQLAAQGLDGSSDIFEGEQGFLAVFADGGDPRYLTEGLGETFCCTDADIKPYPSCRQTHGAVDIALGIAGDPAFDPADIADVEVRIYTYAAQDWYAKNDVPDTWLETLLRIPYCTAACLRFGRIGIDVFGDEARSDPLLRYIVSRTHVVPEPEFDVNWPDDRPAAIRVTLRDGRIFEGSITRPSGSEGTPLGTDKVFEKFASLYSLGFPDRDASAAFDAVTGMNPDHGIGSVLEHFV